MTEKDLERELAQTREDLKSASRTSETRVENKLDWRARVRTQPLAATGIAFGAGLVVGFLF